MSTRSGVLKPRKVPGPRAFPLPALFQTVFLLQRGTFASNSLSCRELRDPSLSQAILVLLSPPYSCCSFSSSVEKAVATATQNFPDWKMSLLLKGSQPLPALNQFFLPPLPCCFFFLAEVLQLKNDGLLFLTCVGKSTPQPKLTGEISFF